MWAGPRASATCACASGEEMSMPSTMRVTMRPSPDRTEMIWSPCADSVPPTERVPASSRSKSPLPPRIPRDAVRRTIASTAQVTTTNQASLTTRRTSQLSMGALFHHLAPGSSSDRPAALRRAAAVASGALSERRWSDVRGRRRAGRGDRVAAWTSSTARGPTTPACPWTPGRRWPCACGRAASTRSWARTTCWPPARPCAGSWSPPTRPAGGARVCPASFCGVRRGRARRPSPTWWRAPPGGASSSCRP